MQGLQAAARMQRAEVSDRAKSQAHLRRTRCDAGIVEEAEAHGAVAAGMVSGWADAAEGVLEFAGQHGIRGFHRCACGQQRGAVGLAVHGRVGVERKVLGGARGNVVVFQPVAHAADGGDVQTAVRQLDLGQVGLARGAAIQRVGHAGNEQAVFNRIDAFGAFGVACAHVVQLAVRMNVVASGAHSFCLQSVNYYDYKV